MAATHFRGFVSFSLVSTNPVPFCFEQPLEKSLSREEPRLRGSWSIQLAGSRSRSQWRRILRSALRRGPNLEPEFSRNLSRMNTVTVSILDETQRRKFHPPQTRDGRRTTGLETVGERGDFRWESRWTLAWRIYEGSLRLLARFGVGRKTVNCSVGANCAGAAAGRELEGFSVF
ncbi:hypothetical protein BJY01DRAFT_32918 [Aspergillus pseudoustus]|uniref:Uncharacterized protein n=1 Tax=Aspergillus pseudoustus TaxID=1810923 RepID=A0ABR4JFK9_9EURO